MIYFVTGASGAGKSASREILEATALNVVWWEFDSLGVPKDADTRWRQKTTEIWVQKALEQQDLGVDVVLCGQTVPGEILAAPSAPRIARLSFCLLDCGDVARIDRLKAAERWVDQDTLNWAAWLRVHSTDPQWRQDVIRGDGWDESCWERWEHWQRGDPRWKIHTIDTTDLDLQQVTAEVSSWIARTGHEVNPVATPDD